MAVATFDTLKFANTLKSAGVPDKQAEAQAVAFADVFTVNMKELATEDDLKHATDLIRTEIKTATELSLKDLKSQIDQLRTETKGQIEQLRAEAKGQFDTQGANIAFIKWTLVLVASGIISLVFRTFFMKG